MRAAGRCVVISLVRFYQRTVSRLLPNTCRFEPSCSSYMIQAIEQHGVFRGAALGIWRVLRCNPFCAGGFDPVPPGRGSDPGRPASEGKEQ